VQQCSCTVDKWYMPDWQYHWLPSELCHELAAIVQLPPTYFYNTATFLVPQKCRPLQSPKAFHVVQLHFDQSLATAQWALQLVAQWLLCSGRSDVACNKVYNHPVVPLDDAWFAGKHTLKNTITFCETSILYLFSAEASLLLVACVFQNFNGLSSYLSTIRLQACPLHHSYLSSS